MNRLEQFNQRRANLLAEVEKLNREESAYYEGQQQQQQELVDKPRLGGVANILKAPGSAPTGGGGTSAGVGVGGVAYVNARQSSFRNMVDDECGRLQQRIIDLQRLSKSLPAHIDPDAERVLYGMLIASMSNGRGF